MHDGGEIDIRGTYCALAIAHLCNMVTLELIDGAAEFIVRCQTFEGGIGPIPDVEAHGGYTFCGLAAMMLLQKTSLLDIESLAQFVTFRQMQAEGGFQGRTNKLVDGCYSFWQGGAATLIQLLYSQNDTSIHIFDHGIHH
jgi:protein farnesyltransferase subunit beta